MNETSRESRERTEPPAVEAGISAVLSGAAAENAGVSAGDGAGTGASTGGPSPASGMASPPADGARTNEPAANATVRRSSLWWRLPLILFAQFLLLILLLLGLALGTQSGLRTLVALFGELAPERLSVDRIEGRLLGRLSVEGLRIDLPELRIEIGGAELDWSPFNAVRGRLDVARLHVRDLDVWLSDTSDESDEPFALPDILLPLALAIDEGRLERLRILRVGNPAPLFVLDEASLAATLEAGALDLTRLEVRLATPDLRAEARGRIQLTGDYPLDLALDLALRPTPELTPELEEAELRGKLQVGGDLARLLLRLDLTESSSDARLSVSGDFAPGPEGGALGLTGLWEGLRWPLSGEPLVVSESGMLEVTGGLDDLAWRLTAAAAGPSLPPLTLAGQGRADTRSLRIAELDAATLDGHLQGQGALTWDPELTWNASLAVAGLDPGLLAPDWPGRIDGQLQVEGRLEAASPRLTARLAGLQGQLRGQPLAGAGTLTLAGETLGFEAVEVRSGPNVLRLAGGLDRQLDLTLSLDAPDLAALAPGARGSLTAGGRLEGPLETPRLRLELAAREAAFGAQGIGRLSGNLDLDLAPDGVFRIDLAGESPVAGDLRWERLSLRGEGQPREHRLELALTGDPLTLNASLTGQLTADHAWRGRLETLALSQPLAGDWRLERPAALGLSAARTLNLGPLCLRETGGSGGCVEFAQGTPESWTASLDFARLDLALLKTLLADTAGLEGQAALRGRFAGSATTLEGRAELRVPTGLAHLNLAQDHRESLDFSGARLTIAADASGLDARLGLPLAGFGTLDGELRLPGWRLQEPARPAQPLAGGVRARLAGFERLAALLPPDIANLTGGLEADLRLGGTLGAPGLRGEARLHDAGFELPLIDLRVSDLNLVASAPTWERIDLRGGATLGGGRLELAGEARLGAAGPGVTLRIDGTGLKVADTREYYLLLSPHFELEANPRGARLGGELRIPEARIRPRSLPAGTVTPSADVEILGQGASAPYPLALDLRLALGDNVTLDAFGVRGRLAGTLSLLQEPGRELLGDGHLQIVDGQYRVSGAFGIASELAPPLKIVQGRLVYVRSPIDNPGLLLQAEREQGKTSAGVRVHGTLRDPKLAFFSETDPNLSQAEITKYLLTGIAPGSENLGAEGGLAVGTYVTPKLYLEYENGLGNEENSVRLRYDLTDRIEVETATGTNQGGGIYFTFER